jgi:PKD repeat protein
MKRALDNLQVSYLSLNYLPENIADHAAVFVSAGTKYNGSHLLTTEEGNLLATYLQSGGKLYLESYSTWYYQKKTRVHPFFKYTSSKIPAWFFPSLKGVPFTFTDSLQFSYIHPSNYALFNFIPTFPAFTSFMNTDTLPKGVQVVYKGDDYSTIGSMFEFGSLIDGSGSSNKVNLMRHYLDLFDVAMPGPRTLFHADKFSICRWGEINFNDDSFDGVVSRVWSFPGGTPATSTEQNPTVQYIDAGSYDVILTVSDGANTRTLTKKGYIQVNVCAGMETNKSPEYIKVYPNPVASRLTLRFTEPVNQGYTLDFFDMMGRKMTGWKQITMAEQKEVMCDVSKFSNGLYFLIVRTPEWSKSTKILVE